MQNTGRAPRNAFREPQPEPQPVKDHDRWATPAPEREEVFETIAADLETSFDESLQ